MSKILAKIILPLLLLCLVALFAAVAKSPDAVKNEATIRFLDVGQGDAILIQKGNFQILIDGGPDDKLLQQLGENMPLGDKSIEIAILTHPHADHLVGLNQLFGRYDIGKIYLTGVSHASNQYLEFLNNIKSKNIPVENPAINSQVFPFDFATLTFLWPGDQFQGKETENLNNTSLVSKFCYYDSCTLLLGDAEIEELESMRQYYETEGLNQIFSAKIVKVSHHGSVNGLDMKLYDIVKPQYAVISVGADNKYGHPHDQVIDYFNKSSIKLFRTDRDGMVEYLINQNDLVIKR